MKNSLWSIFLTFIFMAVLSSGCSSASTPPIPPTPTFTPSPIPPTFTPEPTATVTATLIPSPTLEPTAIGLVHIPNTLIIYYDISGSTENELRAQLDRLGPVDFDGYKNDAMTKGYIRWNWPGYGRSTCDLSATKVSYKIEVIMPRWSPPKNASPDLVAKWVSYVNKLAEHEKGHADFVVDNIETVTDAIKGATCDTAEVAAQAVLTLIRQYDTSYDVTTNHGATEGAIFP